MAKVLIVDDSDVLRMEIREMLENAGHDVTEGVDGNDGLAKSKESQSFDIIISDLNMPEMDGITMIKKIKEQENYKNTPVFMLTTESSKELKIMGKEAGVMLWIVKPVSEAKINSAIEKVLEMAKSA